MDLVIVDNEWVEDRGDRALLDHKEDHNRVVNKDIRVARTKGGNPQQLLLIAFALPPNQSNNVSAYFLSHL